MTINENIAEILGRYDETFSEAYPLDNDLVNEIVSYITENYQPKTTSTDIEELGEDVERPDNMEAIEHAFDEVIKDLILLREHITGFEDARKYDPKHTAGTVPFAPHLSNKSELKKEEEEK